MYSCECALFNTRAAHSQIVLRRESLGLRRDYARRWMFTLEPSRVVSQSRRSSEIRAQ